MKLCEVGITRCCEIGTKAREQMMTPLGQVDDPRREPFGIERCPKDIGGRLGKPCRQVFEKAHCRAVGPYEVPVPVDDERRVRLAGVQHRSEG